MRELSESEYDIAEGLCQLRHTNVGFITMGGCNECAAAVVALVDGTAQGVPLPRIEAGDVEWARTLQSSCVGTRSDPMYARILAVCEAALLAQEGKNG